MKTLASTAAATTLLLASTALAGPVDDIVSQFQSYGYQSIEIRQTGEMVRIEGVRDGVEREITYDLATSTIVRDESGGTGDGSNDDHDADESEDDEDDSSDDHDDDYDDDHDDDDHDDHHDDDDHDDDESDDDEDSDDEDDD